MCPEQEAELNSVSGEDTDSQFGIHLTELAAQELRAILAKRNLSPDSAWLRVAVKGGGCSGFTYLLL